MRKRGAALAAALALAGCGSSLPPAESVVITPPAGKALPLAARVMVFAGQADLERRLAIGLTRYQTEETDLRDGAVLSRAGRALLAKGFERVALNDPSIRPQIVVRFSGKAAWSRMDKVLHLGCTLDAFTADGIPLGTFVSRFDESESDYAGALEPAYAQCLKRPVESFLASPALARLAAAGFAEPPAEAVAAWMRAALGPIPPAR